MTACTNKARGAVVAALAGVLALGAVPAVALATGTADAQVDLLVNIGEDSFANSTVVISGLTQDGLGNYSTVARGDGFAVSAIKVDSVTLKGTDEKLTTDDYSWDVYKADADGNPISGKYQYGDKLSEPGNYVIVITCEKAPYVGETKNVEFAVKPAEFTGVTFTAYEVDPNDLTAKDDYNFMYTGSEIQVGEINDSTLVEGVDYQVKILNSGDAAEDPEVTVLNAGEYYAYIEGLGQYKGSNSKTADFTVEQFNLDEADITVEDQTGTQPPANPTKVVSTKSGFEGTELDPSLVTIKCDGVWGSNNGPYKFDASYDASNKNLTDNGNDGIDSQVDVNKVGALATFEYDGKAIEPGTTYTVDLSKGESFDYGKVAVKADGKALTYVDASNTPKDYDIIVNNGVAGEWTDLKNGVVGVYKVEVKTLHGTSSALADYGFGGSVTFTVKVIEGVVDADAQVYVSMGTDIVTSYTKQYDGVALTDGDFTVKVYDGEGNDITTKVDPVLTIVDSNNNVVTSALNAGEYTLKITSGSGYELTGTTELPITITKVDLTQLKVGALKSWSGAEYLPMAGGSAKPGVDRPGPNVIAATAYNDIVEDLDLQYMKDGKWADLSEITSNDANFSVEKWDAKKGEWVKDTANLCDEGGKYRVVLRGTEAFAKNYDLADEDTNTTAVEFLVVDNSQLEFTDVKPGDAFLNCIDWMFDRGLVKGYANTTVYGQDHQISRADVVVILYRMAKGTPHYNVDLGYSETQGWVTGFDDVDGNMYYAKAIGWASKLGIVHGYDDGNFRPEQSVTREELATMLANFAKNVYDEEVTLDEDALATMPDAGSVSTFAKKAVSWCVANGLMGNGGFINPTGDITRGETAAMDYNYLTKMVGIK